uniref:Elongin-C n=1 Tax=Colobus angolensis palliatus TaxID=336983 RepID=A0A2K5KAG1_COLAP
MDGKEKTYGGYEGPDAMYVKLVSSDDGHEFIVKREYALTSVVQVNFAENRTNEVSIREVPSHVLSKVRYTNSSTKIPKLPIAPETALELLVAANFLDCQIKYILIHC